MGESGGAGEAGGCANGGPVTPPSIASPIETDDWRTRAPPKLGGWVNGMERAWNTDHLAWRVGSDAAAALSAGALVAPIITIIDRLVGVDEDWKWALTI